MKQISLIMSIARVDIDLAESIENSIAKLQSLIDSEHVSSDRKIRALKMLSAYLVKRCSELGQSEDDREVISLRQIRNEMVHGSGWRKRDFSSFHDQLWKGIARLGVSIGSREIENLLAYNLDVPNLRVSEHDASALKVVSVYRPLFASRPKSEQAELFAKLLVRMFTDARSMSLLEQERK